MIVLGGGPGFSHSYLVAGLAPLEQDFELIYIDYPGCGASRARYGAAPFPDTVGLVIEALAARCGSEPVSVLCHSFGAVVLGAALAARAPIKIETCVLANPSPHSRRFCDSAQAALLSRLSGDDMALLGDTLAGRGPPANLVKRLLPYYCGRDHDIPDVDLDFFPDAYLAIAGAADDFDVSDALARIPSRLYLFGSTDFISPNLFDDALGRPGVRATTLQGGHFLFLDAGPEFCRTVTSFFREDSAAGRR